jgi:hypothetical protein
MTIEFETPHQYQLCQDGGHKADRRTIEGKEIYKDAARQSLPCSLDIHQALTRLSFKDLTTFFKLSEQ